MWYQLIQTGACPSNSILMHFGEPETIREVDNVSHTHPDTIPNSCCSRHRNHQKYAQQTSQHWDDKRIVRNSETSRQVFVRETHLKRRSTSTQPALEETTLTTITLTWTMKNVVRAPMVAISPMISTGHTPERIMQITPRHTREKWDGRGLEKKIHHRWEWSPMEFFDCRECERKWVATDHRQPWHTRCVFEPKERKLPQLLD